MNAAVTDRGKDPRRGWVIRIGSLHAPLALACCVSAALISDSVWFQLGRSRGRRILRLLCRVSLEPDSCVRQTENAFVRYGMSSLLVSKFVPGLNAVAAPLAGNSRSSYVRFLLYDAAGATLWSGVKRVVYGAGREDASKLNFEEGPVFPESYQYLMDRGIEIVRNVLRPEAAAVLERYRVKSGKIYNG